MNKDIQFQIECISTELVEMLIQKFKWSIKKLSTNFILRKHTSVYVTLTVDCITKVQYMYSLI